MKTIVIIICLFGWASSLYINHLNRKVINKQWEIIKDQDELIQLQDSLIKMIPNKKLPLNKKSKNTIYSV